MQGEAGETATMARPMAAGADARPRSRGVGALLRETRIESGADLRTVATRLRIRHPYLEAIEEGRFDKLPGMPYAVGFVRAYADHLDLDGAEMVRRFKQETACVDSKSDLNFPEPPPERGMPGGAILLIALVLAITGYGGWYWMSATDVQRPDLVAAVPPHLEAPVARPIAIEPPAPTIAGSTSPAAPAASPAAGRVPEPVREAMVVRQAAEPPAAATAPPTPAPSPPVASVLASTGESAVTTDPRGTDSVRAPAPAMPQPPAAAAATRPTGDLPPTPSATAEADAEIGRMFGAAAGDSRVQIRAIADSWVQVRDADGSLLLTRVLRTGDLYRVPDRPGVTMRTGNAGGLEVSVDGKPVAPVGPAGSVRRNVSLDADRLVAGTAAAE